MPIQKYNKFFGFTDKTCLGRMVLGAVRPPINHQVITSAWNYFNNLSVYLLFSTVYSCTCYFFPVSIFFSTSFNELHPLPFPPGPHALFHRGWRQITTATPLGNSVPIPSHLLST